MTEHHLTKIEGSLHTKHNVNADKTYQNLMKDIETYYNQSHDGTKAKSLTGQAKTEHEKLEHKIQTELKTLNTQLNLPGLTITGLDKSGHMVVKNNKKELYVLDEQNGKIHQGTSGEKGHIRNGKTEYTASVEGKEITFKKVEGNSANPGDNQFTHANPKFEAVYKAMANNEGLPAFGKAYREAVAGLSDDQRDKFLESLQKSLDEKQDGQKHWRIVLETENGHYSKIHEIYSADTSEKLAKQNYAKLESIVYRAKDGYQDYHPAQ